RSLEPHIHLHFQSTPEVGSSTIPITFTQYQDESESKIQIKFNSIPKEREIVNNLSPDFNLKNFFLLSPGETFKIKFEMVGKSIYEDVWKVNLDLMGNRYIEDDRNNRLYFISSLDYFACLDYIGKKKTSLFFFFLAAYRIPYVRNQSFFEDQISYKPFSNIFIRFLKDLIHPFSETVGFQWKSKLKEIDNTIKIESEVIGRSNKPIYEISLDPSKLMPGEINARDLFGNEWILSKI
ncbi:MAG: hypothetical protein AABY22_07070, partial [Nanoarchaeota archaeon]